MQDFFFVSTFFKVGGNTTSVLQTATADASATTVEGYHLHEQQCVAARDYLGESRNGHVNSCKDACDANKECLGFNHGEDNRCQLVKGISTEGCDG
jgi:hypothetical protein